MPTVSGIAAHPCLEREQPRISQNQGCPYLGDYNVQLCMRDQECNALMACGSVEEAFSAALAQWQDLRASESMAYLVMQCRLLDSARLHGGS